MLLYDIGIVLVPPFTQAAFAAVGVFMNVNKQNEINLITERIKSVLLNEAALDVPSFDKSRFACFIVSSVHLIE